MGCVKDPRELGAAWLETRHRFRVIAEGTMDGLPAHSGVLLAFRSRSMAPAAAGPQRRPGPVPADS